MRKLLLTTASVAVLGLTAGAANAARFAESAPSKDSTGYSAPQATPAPGKIVVRVGGNVWSDIGVGSSTLDKAKGNGNKLQPYGMTGGMRLYFGVDGQLNNGILYGANYEIRTNSGLIGGSSANSTANTLYARRAYVYVGGANWGLVRVGQADGPISLFVGNTTGEFFSTGGWDGDVPGLFGNASISWAVGSFLGNEYDSEKVSYVSPSMGGFQLGLSFAPTNSAQTGGIGTSAFLGGVDRQSASTLASDWARPRNIFEIAARYQGNLGPVGTYLMAAYSGSGTVDNNTGAGAKYWGLSVFDLGVAFNYMGFQPFAHLTTGKMNGSFVPQQKLAGRKKDGLAWVAGLAYGNGPYTVGASWYQFDSQGSPGATGNRQERGLAIGGNYNITNGLDFYLEYLYGTRKQSGFDFETNAPGAAVNKTTASGAMATIQVRW